MKNELQNHKVILKYQLTYIMYSRWYKDLDVPTNFPFARDRVAECYFWILGVFFEPQYSLARVLVTKVIILTSICDDIYDVYGTFEELQLFTEAVSRLLAHFLLKCHKYQNLPLKHFALYIT